MSALQAAELIKRDAELLQIKHTDLLKRSRLKENTPKTVVLPKEGSSFAVEVRASTRGYGFRTRPLAGTKLGFAGNMSSLTLGVKLGGDRTAEIIGLDSILIRATRGFSDRLNMVASSGGGRCNLFAAVAHGRVVDPGPDPYAPGIKQTQLVRF
jgi:hypothetical protein